MENFVPRKSFPWQQIVFKAIEIALRHEDVVMSRSALRLLNDVGIEPRYFFDIDDGEEVRDGIGRQLESGALLRAEALRVITALAASEAEDARETNLVLRVRDPSGDVTLKVRLVCQVEEV